MAEWSNAVDSKSIVLVRVPGVRISLSPPICTLSSGCFFYREIQTPSWVRILASYCSFFQCLVSFFIKFSFFLKLLFTFCIFFLYCWRLFYLFKYIYVWRKKEFYQSLSPLWCLVEQSFAVISIVNRSVKKYANLAIYLNLTLIWIATKRFNSR